MASDQPSDRIQQAWEKTLRNPALLESGDPGATYRPPPQNSSTLISKQMLQTLKGAAEDTRIEAPGQEATVRGVSEKAPGGPPHAPDPADDGGFTILEKVGEGGMGVIWLAEQGALRREVAVKTIKGAGGSAEDNLFVSEAMVTGFLEHPNIVPVHVLGHNTEGHLFIAMKLARGVSWKKLLHPEGSDPQARTAELEKHLHILLSVCNAIGFAHSRNIIHRDLKPENVMAGEFGEVLVMDWGLAVDVTDPQPKVSRTIHRSAISGAGGTPAYMAPEMTEGDGAQLGPWTDVYLLGAILHEILAGRPPHSGSLRAALLSAFESKPPVFAKGVPEELGAICAKACAREPGARYASVAAFQQALEEFLKHRQSLLITERADAEALALAEPGAELLKNYRELYDRHAKVVARFEQALELWSGNAAAGRGVRAARLAFAEAALASGDLGLAEAQVNRVAADDPAGIALRGRASAAREAQEQKERSARAARRALIAAAAVIIVGLTVAFFWIRSEQRIAEEQRNAAVAEKQRAEASDKLARQEAARADSEARAAKLELARGLIQQGDAFATASRFNEAASRYWDAIGSLERLKAGTFDAETGLFDVRRQRPLAFSAFTAGGDVNGGAFTPDGRRIVAADAKGTVNIWDAFSGIKVQSFHAHLVTTAMVLSPDGQHALTSGIDQAGGKWELKLWDLATGGLLRTLPPPAAPSHTQFVGSLAFSFDGKRALSGSWDGSMKLWNLESGAELRTFTGHADRLNCVALSEDGARALSASNDGTAKVWDVESGREVRTFKTGIFVAAAVFVPSGNKILTGGGTKNVTLWDADNGAELRTFTGHPDAVSALAVSGNGALLASASFDGSVRLWDLASGNLLRVFEVTKWIRVVTFSADGKKLLAGGDDGALHVWDTSFSGELRELKVHKGYVPCAAFSPDGRWAVTGGSDPLVKLWDIQTGRELASLSGHSAPIRAIAVSPDGTRILSGSADKSLKLWDVASGKELRTFTGHTDQIAAVAFAPDGKRALSGSWDRTLKLWDLDSGNEIRTFTGHGGAVYGLAYSPDGARAISCSFDGALKLWDCESGREIHTYTGHDTTVAAVAFSPDGQNVVSASWDKMLKIWQVDAPAAPPFDAAALEPGAAFEVEWQKKWYPSTLKKKDGQHYLIHYEGWDERWDESVTAERMRAVQPRADLQTLRGHSQFVTACAYFPDGQRVLSGSYDQSLRIWDAASGRELRTLNYHPGAIDCAALSPDGQHILSASRDGSVFVADLSRPMRERALAARLARDTTLASFGEWYAFHGQFAWAADALTRARASGAAISLTTLAQCDWLCGRNADATTAFEAALDEVSKATPSDEAAKRRRAFEVEYLRLCIRALRTAPQK